MCVCMFCFCRVHAKLIVSFWSSVELISAKQNKIASPTIKTLASSLKDAECSFFSLARYCTYHSIIAIAMHQQNDEWQKKRKNCRLIFVFNSMWYRLVFSYARAFNLCKWYSTICDAYTRPLYGLAYFPSSRFIHLIFVRCILLRCYFFSCFAVLCSARLCFYWNAIKLFSGNLSINLLAWLCDISLSLRCFAFAIFYLTSLIFLLFK